MTHPLRFPVVRPPPVRRHITALGQRTLLLPRLPNPSNLPRNKLPVPVTSSQALFPEVHTKGMLPRDTTLSDRGRRKAECRPLLNGPVRLTPPGDLGCRSLVLRRPPELPPELPPPELDPSVYEDGPPLHLPRSQLLTSSTSPPGQDGLAVQFVPPSLHV